MIEQQVIPLECLKSGEHGRIHHVDGERDDVHRLSEIGFRTGVRVRMVRPGRPCILALDNHRMSFRAAEAATVLVEVVDNGTPAANNGTNAG